MLVIDLCLCQLGTQLTCCVVRAASNFQNSFLKQVLQFLFHLPCINKILVTLKIQLNFDFVSCTCCKLGALHMVIYVMQEVNWKF